MDNTYVLYQHAGSGNHGCEALIRTVIATIRNFDENGNFVVVSSKPFEDEKYGIGTIASTKIVNLNKKVNKFSANWWMYQLGKVLHSRSLQDNALFYLDWISEEKSTYYIAIGGDNYCYNKGRSFYVIDNLLPNKHKMLWGCSIEPGDIDDTMIQHLSNFAMISVRERITYHALQDAGLENVWYIPDTAFILPQQEYSVLNKKKKYVGINISPLIMNYTNNSEMIYSNYRNLITYLLENTDFELLFIPHVVTDGNDDREAITILMEGLHENQRIHVINDANCMKLKNVISKTEFFIGARTHATIAAYSTGVPTLVVGYSVKSKGIARQLFGTEEGYVIAVDHLYSTDDLKNAYIQMSKNIDSIKDQLNKKTSENQNAIYTEYTKLLTKWITETRRSNQ